MKHIFCDICGNLRYTLVEGCKTPNSIITNMDLCIVCENKIHGFIDKLKKYKGKRKGATNG